MNLRATEIAEDFNFLPEKDRLQLLLEFSENLPPLDPKYGEHPELLERVEECQSPVFIAVDGTADQIRLHFSAPQEAPTTRGFASVLHSALDGLSAQEILDTSDDFPSALGLDKLISPLRVRGMRGMLARIKRKTRELNS
ncbi:SufE family protein [Aquiluna borgnonia]|uniref:SufE family protein n=1 Tax=Aquiluna borgnonia TaxID=2499157 RepID=A0A7D4ULL9_9MICO|nr:SufE family protein [Aquiluna borgnonia]QKJ25238.1 SufE family protein [Aquiluna borgnonia]